MKTQPCRRLQRGFTSDQANTIETVHRFHREDSLTTDCTDDTDQVMNEIQRVGLADTDDSANSSIRDISVIRGQLRIRRQELPNGKT
jgi:hypothetical protein